MNTAEEGLVNLKDGDRRNVTVLFTDMEGFTSLAEQLDPEEVDSLLGSLFSRFEAIVRRHDGTVEKYIGDAMVAAFGVPRIHEDDAVRAVHAALDFQDAVASVNRRLSNKGAQFRFRTGIHTGLITTGRRGEFDVITGNTMNVAARLQQSAPPGATWISQATLDECGADFMVSGPMSLQLKGKSDFVVAWEVRQRNSQSLVPEPRFKGHKDLIDSMVAGYLRHNGRNPGGYLVTGAAGIGKTAVVRKFIEAIRRLPDFRSPVLHARARRFRTLPFAVISDLIAGHTDIDTRWEEMQIAEALVDRLGILGNTARDFARFLRESGQGDPDVSGAFPLLNTILRSIMGQDQQARFPPVIFIDNSSFMDRQSLDFLAWFMGKTESFPFLVLAEREPRQEVASLIPGLQVMEVPPLEAHHAEELLREVLSDMDTDCIDIPAILKQSEGIPLFIHAYGKYLHNNCSAGVSVPWDLPQTIQNLFLTNISTFNDDIRDFLKKTSVFVQNFTVEDARFIHVQTEGDPSIVEPALAFFEQEEILQQDKGFWFFRHDIFKKALYGSLLNYNKKLLHQLVVKIMRKQEAPDTLRLVHHLIRSDQHDDARALLMKAPLGLHNLDYLPYYDALLQALPDGESPERLGLLFRKASLLFNNGHAQEADRMVKEMLRVALGKGESAYAASAYHLLVAYNARSFRFQKADFCAQKALVHYGQDPSTMPNRMAVLAMQAVNHVLAGRGQDDPPCLGEMEALARAMPELCPQLLECRLDLELLRDRANLALSHLGGCDGRGGSEQTGSEQTGSLLGAKRGQVLAALGRLDEAAAVWDAWLKASPRQNLAGTVLAQRAVVAHLRNEASSGALVDEAEFLALRSGNDYDHLDILAALSEAWATLGDWDSLRQWGVQGLVDGQRHSALYPAFTLVATWIEMLFASGQVDQSAFFLEEARLMVAQEPRVKRRDLMVYHHAEWTMGRGDAHRAEAQALLEAELALRGDNPQAFLGMRTFGAIAESLAKGR